MVIVRLYAVSPCKHTRVFPAPPDSSVFWAPGGSTTLLGRCFCPKWTPLVHGLVTNPQATVQITRSIEIEEPSNLLKTIQFYFCMRSFNLNDRANMSYILYKQKSNWLFPSGWLCWWNLEPTQSGRNKRCNIYWIGDCWWFLVFYMRETIQHYGIQITS